jgi:hypothetical protein
VYSAISPMVKGDVQVLAVIKSEVRTLPSVYPLL